MEAKAKHTPGPWTVHDEYEPIQIWGKCSGASRYEAGEDCTLALVQSWDGEPTESEMKANARLIAAAPDLLAALEGLVAWADDAKRPNPTADLDAARESIAKATGNA